MALDLDKYFAQGYLSLFSYDEDELNDNNLELIDIDEQDIKSYFNDISVLRERLCLTDKVVLIKFLSKYHITIKDVFNILKEQLESTPNYYLLVFWVYFVSLNDGVNGFLPNIDANKEDFDDYLFKNEDHLVSFIIDNLKVELEEETVNEIVLKYYTFINDILYSSTEDYSDVTKTIILKTIANGLDNNKNISIEALNYFHVELQTLAEKENNWAMLSLGYNYYEGVNSFDVNYNKSCYFLEKYFKNTGDPDVARTLGYIYYYGRNNSGIPIKDKAFQYFSIAHIAGDNVEATYKLADCYLNGYGTIISHISAFKLVEAVYMPNLKKFLKDEESKFADIALRMGNFYKDGIYVDKNLYEAQLFYLEALCAIEDRMSKMNYIGDSNVKNNILRSLNEVNKELGIIKLEPFNEKCILKNQKALYKDCDFKIDVLNEMLHIEITNKEESEEKYFINIASEISYVNKTEKVEYLLKPFDPSSMHDFVKSFEGKSITKVVIDGEYLIIIIEEELEIPSIILCEEIYLKI